MKRAASSVGGGVAMRAQLGTPRKTTLKDAEEAVGLVLQSLHNNAATER